jgi:predicted phage baseplate assembly protein
MGEGTEDFPPKIDDPSVSARIVTWLRIRLPQPSGANATGAPTSARITWAGINAVQIRQAVSVFNEFVGTATGEPEQAYRLANSPVLPNTLTLATQSTVGAVATATAWAPIDDLLSAGPADRVFTLDPEAGQIQFGSGIYGTRPALGDRIVVSYQYGGGPQGNVGIGSVSSTRDLRLQGGYQVSNPIATSGGDAGQSVSDAERTIPQIIRHKDRLVTAQDFAEVAMQAPGVDINRVDVLPLFSPGPPPQDNAPGVVTLMAVPVTDLANPLWPMPDRLFLKRLCDYLDTRRLVTTELYVRGPDYVPVYVSIGIAVQAGYFPDLVRQAVTAGLRSYLSSLRGLGPTGLGWPLRKTLLKKDIEAAATRIPGVEFVNATLLGGSGGIDTDSIDFTGLQLPRLDGLLVVEGDPQPLASVLGAIVQPAQPGISIVPVPVIRAKC